MFRYYIVYIYISERTPRNRLIVNVILHSWVVDFLFYFFHFLFLFFLLFVRWKFYRFFRCCTKRARRIPPRNQRSYNNIYRRRVRHVFFSFFLSASFPKIYFLKNTNFSRGKIQTVGTIRRKIKKKESKNVSWQKPVRMKSS